MLHQIAQHARGLAQLRGIAGRGFGGGEQKHRLRHVAGKAQAQGVAGRCRVGQPHRDNLPLDFDHRNALRLALHQAGERLADR